MKVEQALTIIDRRLSKELSDLQRLILQYSWQGKSYREIADECGYSSDYIRENGAKLWQLLSETFDTKITKKNWHRIFEEWELSRDFPLASEENRDRDWEGIIDVSSFRGRSQEITTLERWIIEERCRLIGILGIGGIGKTSLAIKLGQKIASDFDYVIWRSLKNAPKVEQILVDIIQFVSEFQGLEINLASDIESTIARLITYLKSHRCLLILDNVESILQTDRFCGRYRQGYEDYGKLLQSWGEIEHQSCLILTSREKPQELVSLSGNLFPVRCWQLSGLKLTAVKDILELKGGLVGSAVDWQALRDNYRGNPLALKIVATIISELFDGRINYFLEQNILLFDDLENLFAQQFKRLSQLEKDIINWLAIEREAISISQLQRDLLIPCSPQQILDALKSLIRRSLIEKVPEGFTLQPVVMEYTISKILKQVSTEIETTQPQLLISHALIKAQGQEYVRHSQNRTILSPLASQLLREVKRSTIEIQLQQIVNDLRGKAKSEVGYGVGNIINLLRQLDIELSNYDFSQSYIRQAFLQNVQLHHVKLAEAQIDESVFSESLDLVFAVAINPQGTVLASGSFTGEIYLWQIPQGRQILNFAAHENWVHSLAFSGDGRMLVSCSYDGTVKLWDTETGTCRGVLETTAAPISAVVFSPDARILARSSHDGSIKLWNTRTWHCSHTYFLASSIFHLAFSPDLRYLLCGCGDGLVRIINLTTGKLCQTWEGHQDIVYALVWENNYQFFSGSFDGTIKRWHFPTGRCLQTLKGHSNKVSYLGLNSEANILVSSSFDRTIRLWGLDTGKCLQVLQGHEDSIWSFALSPDGNTIASGSLDSSVKLWNFNTGKLLNNLQGYQKGIWSIAYSPDGQTLVSGSGDRTVRLWDVNTGNCLHNWQAHHHQVSAVAYSPDGRLLASSSSKGKVKLWQVDTGECIYSCDRHHDWVWGLAFSADGSILASGGHDCLINLWDVATGKCLATFTDRNVIWSVTFSADGLLLASGNYDCEVKLWDVKTKQCLKILLGHQGYINSVVFSPQNNLIASAGYDATVKLWDRNSGECLATLEGHTNIIWSIAFSPDGSLLASAGSDRTIKIWDINSNKCIKSFPETSYRVDSLAFSPDSLSVRGKILTSSSQEGLIKLWQVDTGKCFRVIRPNRLYESMDITGIRGLSPAQKETLQILGAVNRN